ncbi:hypothetical protein C173_19331 [Paenibacillus sp. FSL R7-277]|uniref:hypothetical protein n=1 Tax=Paenibacillus sp. FSL R7-277 TaxID=1227352 RepID=UPI0003E2A929|nr:hypothetical protein [Paenibacillus sp. FSL R7-277]ETT65214.1 hypothetical protein C173_19331 [Paenibacillus sp. FSL R7-277]
MKKIMMKAMLATALLAGSISGQVGSAHATAAKPTAAPIMRDNLTKFGLVKDVELPVTVTAGGLSYTLEKIMIFDSKSKDAQALAKQYGYDLDGAQYFIWTKINIENKGDKIIQKNSKDLSEKWRLNFGDLSKGEAYVSMPLKTVLVQNYKPNNKQALWSWVLKPGEKLSSYQGYLYSGKFNYFEIWLDNKGASATKYIVNEKK